MGLAEVVILLVIVGTPVVMLTLLARAVTRRKRAERDRPPDRQG